MMPRYRKGDAVVDAVMRAANCRWYLVLVNGRMRSSPVFGDCGAAYPDQSRLYGVVVYATCPADAAFCAMRDLVSGVSVCSIPENAAKLELINVFRGSDFAAAIRRLRRDYGDARLIEPVSRPWPESVKAVLSQGGAA